jgi:hypothetical protein
MYVESLVTDPPAVLAGPALWREREEPAQAPNNSEILIFKLTLGARFELTFGLGATGLALMVALPLMVTAEDPRVPTTMYVPAADCAANVIALPVPAFESTVVGPLLSA